MLATSLLQSIQTTHKTSKYIKSIYKRDITDNTTYKGFNSIALILHRFTLKYIGIKGSTN